MSLKSGCKLAKLWLKRRKSHDNYIAFQIARAGLLQKELSKFIKTQKNLKLLDIGSHRGGYSIAFARLGYKVTGLELNPGRIETAKKASLSHNLDIKFILADARNTPFKDNEFDVILLSNVIEHIKDTKKLLKELKRILKPGGLLYIQFPPYLGFFGGHIYFKSISLPKPARNFLIRAFNLESELEEIEPILIDKLINLSRQLGFKIKLLNSTPRFMFKIKPIREYVLFYRIILEK